MTQTAPQLAYTLQLSYTLSRVTGNYTGLFDQDTRVPNPNGGSNYTDTVRVAEIGLLANDRPHVLKVSGGYRFRGGVQVGMYGTWQSGTPLNDQGAHPFDPFSFSYLKPRGSVGRTPAVLDLNFQLARQFEPAWLLGSSLRLRADLLHAFSRRVPVSLIQQHYFGRDEAGNPTQENPLYLRPLAYHPPMALRLGLEASF